MGKMKRVSLPYAPGGTVYWTVYTYDGLGRTLSVAQPNGSGTTTYLYVGNTVKVTSPSGKWKQYEMDALGRMTLVTEPRPGGGTYTTSYGYNVAGKLVSVSMPRDGVTQTRTFTYDTTTQSRLLSATNPENGTVNYTYNPDGTTATKTDAKGIKTEFSYDAYKRVLQMRKLTQVSGNWTEDRCQRTDYFYDEGGGTNNGRLTRVKWNWTINEYSQEVPCSVAGGFTESYSYNSAGRILSKNLTLTKSSNGNTGSAYLIANWAYNNEGQVTGVTYPQHVEGSTVSRREVTHGFDSMARLNSVQTKLATDGQPNPGWQSVISGVQFNAFGAVTSLNHLGVTESRTYNILGQMTRMTKGSLIDVEYRFSTTANDGKILSQKNWLSGEDVTYQYDELERLISASTTAGISWGLSWSYDGFGNRLSQTVTQGTGPSSVTLVNGNTNRISSAGYAYDPNGNMTQMPKGSGSMTLDYDLSNRVSGVSHPDGTEQYRYAPDNRRVWRSAGRSACYASRDNDGMGYWVGYGEGVEEQVIFYSPGGQKMGSYCLRFSQNLQYFAVSASEENVYYGGRLVGKRLLSVTNSNNGLVSDFTADRLQSKGNGSNYYPYGESKPSTAGDDREGFATYTRDEKSGLDYADQRWYASGVGRFTSVDLAQIKVLKAGGLLNGYAYVDSDPINRLDPRGLYYCVPEYHPNGDEQCFTTEPDLTDGSPPPLPPAPAPTKKGLYGDCNPGDSKSETDNLSFLVANYEAAEKVAEIVSQLFNTSMSAGTVLSWAISESGWGTSPKIGSNGTYLNARTGGNWIEQSTCKAGSDARWACFASFEQSLTSGFFSPMFMTGYVDRNGISTDRPSAGYIYADQIARGSSIAITFQQIAGGGSGGGWDRGNSKYGTNVQDVLRGVNIRLDCLKLNNYIK